MLETKKILQNNVNDSFFIPNKILTFKIRGNNNVYKGIRVQYSRIFGPYAGGVIFSEEMDLDTLIDLTIISFIRNILFNLPLGSSIGCICAPRSQDKKILISQYINYVRNNIDEDILIPDEGTEDMSELFYEIANIDEKYITNIIYTDYLSYSIGIAILLKFALKGNFNVKIGILGSNPANTTLFSLLESLGSEVFSANLNSKCDALIITSGKKIVNSFNQDKIEAKIVVEGSDLAITYDGYKKLRNRGIIVVPDVLANSGKAIGIYLKWVNNRIGKVMYNEEETIRFLYEKINRTLREIINENKKLDELKETLFLTALSKISHTY
ncbi:Glu/Leu/Phe/Val dehydrogenase dimerization domain-containing protein [Sulfurisphaera ohwakuensis]|uniref:Glutamate dehydrogenase/leucine dehydrogenase n=1 Tax=Sulfurisphaera ohwakuensis TaxID=69656 RepID=A0A650CKI1_SULOH|nr:Glu/Leu/Phe/Val dehydrogenase dimerization domain-containing protein [Sulfurisphaera ohwakuensis]MBB5253681.1 glutamate dehydrogenase/leucine dehydrogenase [Sulfurisphaera ohwakuensis]QGR18336.1 hypothetical protein D1869_14905 [Sulfurisphaera ohwakuensis]